MPICIVATDEEPETTYDGRLFRGVKCNCSGRGHYLFPLPLSHEDIEKIGRSPWGGRGGRKYGPSNAKWYVSANPACRVPGTGLRPRTDADERGPRPMVLTGVQLKLLRSLALDWTLMDDTATEPLATVPLSADLPIDSESVSLSDDDFRRSLFSCHKCFPEGAACSHHEDLVGGYKRRPIVIVGINPQAHPDNKEYQEFQLADCDTKIAFGDHALDWLAGRPVKLVFREDFYRTHRGLCRWVPMVATLLGVTHEELAEHFVFVEAVKHATSDVEALERLPQATAIKKQCPSTWLLPQLKRLAPSLVLFCGNRGVEVARCLFSQSPHPSGGITELHGQSLVCLEELGARASYCIAFSERTRPLWTEEKDGLRVPTKATLALQELIRDEVNIRRRTMSCDE